ncbi:ATP-binding protein [Streptomyces sp. NPDC006656]|uniref:ATP-binding protein n=1 Tax=Streptomyces TaxID=1883 RepID=UPI0033E3671E
MDRITSLASVIGTPEQQTSLRLAANDRAPGRARSFTRNVLTAWGAGDLLDQAVLIVSELTTNAERYGRTPGTGGILPPDTECEAVDEITLTLALKAGVVGIEVEDNSPQPPVPRVPSLYASSGRGLCLVSAMADVWTACPLKDGTGKRVIAFIKRMESPVTP